MLNRWFASWVELGGLYYKIIELQKPGGPINTSGVTLDFQLAPPFGLEMRVASGDDTHVGDTIGLTQNIVFSERHTRYGVGDNPRGFSDQLIGNYLRDVQEPVRYGSESPPTPESPFFDLDSYAVLEKSSIPGVYAQVTLQLASPRPFFAPLHCEFLNETTGDTSDVRLATLSVSEKLVVNLYDGNKEATIMQWKWGYSYTVEYDHTGNPPARVIEHQEDDVETLFSDFTPTAGPGEGRIERQWDAGYSMSHALSLAE